MYMKKKIIIIIPIMIILVSIICFVTYQDDQLKFKLSYEYINYIEYDNGKKIKVSIPSNNKIKYVSNTEILDILDSKTGIIYFGYNTCPWCRNAAPILIEAAKENNIETIYYADIHKLKLSNIREELYNKLDSYLSINEEGKKALAVPAVYFVVDGNIVCNHTGTVDSYHNPYNKMTTEQEQELLNIEKPEEMTGESILVK